MVLIVFRLARATRGRFARGSSGNPRGRPPGIPNPKRRVPDLVARPLSAQALSHLLDRKPYLLRPLAAQLLPPPLRAIDPGERLGIDLASLRTVEDVRKVFAPVWTAISRGEIAPGKGARIARRLRARLRVLRRFARLGKSHAAFAADEEEGVPLEEFARDAGERLRPLGADGATGVIDGHEVAIGQERAALTPKPRRPQAAPMARAEESPLMPAGANRPLAGIIVLDFGQVYQGPYATLLMAKAGADVIKIEPPQGEPLRRRAPPGKSTTFPIAMLNSNKRAITLNLKHERGRALLFRMAERGDVLLENFAPGVMDRLGVGWEVLHRINPRLVYASGSGYGLTGPDRDNLAMDLTIQAVSGLIAATGFPDAPPVKAGPAVVDFISGIHLYAATLTALFERERTGRGRLVEVAMQEAAYATLTSQLHAYFETGQPPPRTGNASHGRVPLNVYPTNDGYVAMNIAVEEHWHNLLRAMGREDLRDDPRFADNAARVANREATDALVAAWTRTLGKMEAFVIAKRHRIPLAPVREVDEVMRDHHMHERGMLVWIEHDEIGRIVVPTTPLRIHGADPVDTVPSPKLGQHNREVYGDWLGLPAAEIAALEQDGVI